MVESLRALRSMWAWKAASSQEGPVIVILPFDVGPEAGIEFVERRDLTSIDPVQESLPECPPPAFDLPFSRAVSRPAEDEPDVERGAQHPQVVSGETRVVVKQQRPGYAATGDGVVENREESVPGFAEAGLEIGNDAAAVVDQTEDDRVLAAAAGGVDKDGSVQCVSLPEFSTHGGLPAVAGRAVQLQPGARQPPAAQEPLHGGDINLVPADAAGQFQFAHDERAGAAGVLALEINDQLLDLRCQGPAVAAIRAGDGLEGFESAVAVAVQPFLEGLMSNAALTAAVVFERPTGEVGEQMAQLSPPEVAAERFAEDGVSKKSFAGAVIIIHEILLIRVR